MRKLNDFTGILIALRYNSLTNIRVIGVTKYKRTNVSMLYVMYPSMFVCQVKECYKLSYIVNVLCMPELCERYFEFPTGDMIECTYCKEWY